MHIKNYNTIGHFLQKFVWDVRRPQTPDLGLNFGAFLPSLIQLFSKFSRNVPLNSFVLSQELVSDSVIYEFIKIIFHEVITNWKGQFWIVKIMVHRQKKNVVQQQKQHPACASLQQNWIEKAIFGLIECNSEGARDTERLPTSTCQYSVTVTLWNSLLAKRDGCYRFTEIYKLIGFHLNIQPAENNHWCAYDTLLQNL